MPKNNIIIYHDCALVEKKLYKICINFDFREDLMSVCIQIVSGFIRVKELLVLSKEKKTDKTFETCLQIDG